MQRRQFDRKTVMMRPPRRDTDLSGLTTKELGEIPSLTERERRIIAQRDGNAILCTDETYTEAEFKYIESKLLAITHAIRERKNNHGQVRNISSTEVVFPK